MNASEARKLTNMNRNTDSKQCYSSVMKVIKEAAESGMYHTFYYGDIDEMTKSNLSEDGYVVVFVHNFRNISYYCIKWN